MEAPGTGVTDGCEPLLPNVHSGNFPGVQVPYTAAHILPSSYAIEVTGNTLNSFYRVRKLCSRILLHLTALVLRCSFCGPASLALDYRSHNALLPLLFYISSSDPSQEPGTPGQLQKT